MDGGSFVFLLVIVVVLIIAMKMIRIVPQANAVIFERLGRFHKLATNGMNIVIPLIDKPRGVYWTHFRPGMTNIDLREQYTDLPLQPVITRDNVTLNVDSVVYWQITDPIKAVYEVADLSGSINQLTTTAMRNVMGELDLDHALASRETINAKLRVILDEATHKWGVKVTRVEVKNINPPEDIRVTMEKQMTAERNRRALVLEADGQKQAAITRAEGEKQAAIARAEGEMQAAILAAEGAAQARIKTAEAEAEAIRRIAQALGQFGDPAHYLITSRYIESLRQMAESRNSKVVFMPMETASLMSSVGALTELVKERVGVTEELAPSAPMRTVRPMKDQ
ncbi:MAG: SPFH domain-containing protein [Acidobacteriota bacterium]|nr:SPFH/Band 7/PHB domain protein [Blastocatellia bacterium]MDW8241206.1 SPFH domain-containing protein [Acidobacteriota bacterium]